MKILTAVLATLIFTGLAGVAYVYSGTFDIGADTAHSAAVLGLVGFTRERAISVRSHNIDVPASLDDPARIAAGAGEYAEMCAGCHLAPGMAENELRSGLYPKPPKLAERHAEESPAARQFWIVKHGIKMSSMPAWGLTHDDETLWNIVAFVRKLPAMTPAQYAALTADSESTHEAAGHGDHSDPPGHHH